MVHVETAELPASDRGQIVLRLRLGHMPTGHGVVADAIHHALAGFQSGQTLDFLAEFVGLGFLLHHGLILVKVVAGQNRYGVPVFATLVPLLMSRGEFGLQSG